MFGAKVLRQVSSWSFVFRALSPSLCDVRGTLPGKGDTCYGHANKNEHRNARGSEVHSYPEHGADAASGQLKRRRARGSAGGQMWSKKILAVKSELQCGISREHRQKKTKNVKKKKSSREEHSTKATTIQLLYFSAHSVFSPGYALINK